MFRTLIDFARFTRLTWILARHDALIPQEFDAQVPGAVRLFGKITRIGTRTKGLRPGQRLARALAGQGPAYVKFGQLLATRPDIIGFEMAEDLSLLQDKMAPFSLDQAKRDVEQAFGKPLDQLFSSFSEPIAAASIAQVHKATLPDGQEVAVKILRPKSEDKAKREFRTLLFGARLVQRLVPAAKRLEPIQFVQTLMESSELELDLRLEAGSASELAENLSEHERLRLPEVIWHRCSRRVLTVEWINGTPVTDLAALDAAGFDRKALARLTMQSFLTQALEHGFFHADMHQGNLFVDTSGKLVLLDFGIMGRLDKPARKAFAEIIYGFIQRDYQLAAKAHFDAGYVPEHFNVDAFATALRAVGEPIFGKKADQLDMSRVLQQLFDVTDVYDMHLRPELVLLQRTMVVVEGVARVLDPEIDLWGTAEPIVRAYIEREVGPGAVLRRAKENITAARSLIEAFPEFAQAAENVAGQLANGGIQLSDETILRLARALKGKPLDPDPRNR